MNRLNLLGWARRRVLAGVLVLAAAGTGAGAGAATAAAGTAALFGQHARVTQNALGTVACTSLSFCVAGTLESRKVATFGGTSWSNPMRADSKGYYPS
jgi:hypothetical protein